MADIKIIVQGYAKEIDGKEFASSTTTLIKDNETNIIVDPGMDRNALLTGLQKENLTPKDINYVILTHTHLDHSLLTGIFENATVLDNSDYFKFTGEIGSHNQNPTPDTTIIETPAHDEFHCSVIVNTEVFGKVAIAGDVFWWLDSEEQKIDKNNLLEHKDPYVKNQEKLNQSRKKLIEKADWIIPGHGSMFKLDN